MKLQLERDAAWKRVQPGGMLPLRGTSQRISARRDEAEGLHPKGEHLEGSSPQGARLRESPVGASSPRSTPAGLGAATSSGPSKDSMQVTGLVAIAGGARRNASGSRLRPRCSSGQANPGHGPAPNPSGQPREAVRRQQSVPGEMLLAPAGGRGGRGAALGCCRQR